jgi:hypothetical protein
MFFFGMALGRRTPKWMVVVALLSGISGVVFGILSTLVQVGKIK